MSRREQAVMPRNYPNFARAPLRGRFAHLHLSALERAVLTCDRLRLKSLDEIRALRFLQVLTTIIASYTQKRSFGARQTAPAYPLVVTGHERVRHAPSNSNANAF